MIHEFKITPRVFVHVPQPDVLMDGIVNLVNSYTVEFMRGKTKFVVQDYDSGLLKVLPRALDRGLPTAIRPYINACILRPDNTEYAELLVDWDETHINIAQLEASMASLQ